jgi:hypothetical protein
VPKKKIKPSQPTGSSQREIRSGKVKPKGISFSFKYFFPNHDKFRCHDREINYLLKLLDRLKALSDLTAIELIQNGSQALRCHSIDWENTTERSFGIPAEDQLVDRPYQFSLSSNEHGRVHGFFIDEVFYIVWLDPNHFLYR